jgi:hypothetical protein
VAGLGPGAKPGFQNQALGISPLVWK